MITKMFYSTFFFATLKAAPYKIVNDKYLVPLPPKRALSAYIIFSQAVRAQFPPSTPTHTIKVTEQAKAISQQWKNLLPEQKKRYQDEAVHLKEDHQTAMDQYKTKYQLPFKKYNHHTLFIKLFYQQNKVSLSEGIEMIKKLKQSMTPQQIQQYKDEAQRLNAQNEAYIKSFQIPNKQYKTLSSYIKHVCQTQGRPIPKMTQLDQVSLQYYQNRYNQYIKFSGQQLNHFLNYYQIQFGQLQKLLLKSRSPIEIVDQQKQIVRTISSIQKQKIKKQLKTSKDKLSVINQSIKTGIKKKGKNIRDSKSLPSQIKERMPHFKNAPQVNENALPQTNQNAQLHVDPNTQSQTHLNVQHHPNPTVLLQSKQKSQPLKNSPGYQLSPPFINHASHTAQRPPYQPLTQPVSHHIPPPPVHQAQTAQSPSSQAVQTQPPSTQAVQTQAPSTQAVQTQAPSTQAAQTQTIAEQIKK